MLTLELAKAHLRVEDAFEDEVIESYIVAAQDLLENFTGRRFERGEVVEEVEDFTPSLRLWRGPSPSDLTVGYLDPDGEEQTVSDPRLLGSRIYPPIAGWPARLDASPITLTYTAGYAVDALPPSLLHAQLLIIGHWWADREGASAFDLPAPAAALARQFRSLF